MDNLTPEAALDLLTNALVGHVAVVDEGVPYVSPVSYVIVDNELYFRTTTGRRIDALRKNPNVSIEVMRTREDGGWECVIASGSAYEVDDPTTDWSVVSGLLSKYSDQLGSPLSRGRRAPIGEEPVIIGVKLSDISGRSSGTWFSIPTRPGRL